jgi:hypothetical protein
LSISVVLQREFLIGGTVGYSADSSIGAVGYSANFFATVANIADLYRKIISYISAISYIGE